MIRKNYFLFTFISLFLLLPQPQIRSNIGLRDKIILGCVGVLASIATGVIIYAKSPLSNETEIQRAKQLIDDSNKLFTDVSTKYKTTPFQSIEQLKANLEKKKDTTSYPFYQFVSELNDATCSLNNMIKKLEAKRKHLLARKTALTSAPDSHRYSKEYSSLIDAISLLTKELQALSNNLANLHKKVAALQEYKDEQPISPNWSEGKIGAKNRFDSRTRAQKYNPLDNYNSGTIQKRKKTPVKATPKAKAFNPALTSFWEDPFNF